ncbi:tetratricopeptide repeat protein [Crateriforma conspicua]|uniref:Tetratricopeptide repeat protein n=1 Tax=Crateriforma conspicua TaxID=2527996 RepID=A0A5C5Y707_9PLAN|nr:hypothetical protein [Crateriforma conspicua]QDV65325.1 hypothetical protein Mal65_44950 [Crateriforma conspicua]TWT70719.1 hypothetical protein Pan14r_30260 [Crateriforma conspicua]
MSLLRPLSLLLVVCLFAGCGDDRDLVREIQASRQARVQTESKQDHLGEAFSLLQRLVELNPTRAQQQIRFHLNQWLQTRGDVPASVTPEIVSTLRGVVPQEVLDEQIGGTNFVGGDVKHLRDAYLFRQIVQWVDRPGETDPLWMSWFEDGAGGLDPDSLDSLQTASRLFDWTVRNVALQPRVLTQPAPEPPPLPEGLEFRGAGYRQSDYETIWRGTGDGLQRAGVFEQLCRQAGLAAAILAVPSDDSGRLTPWAVGVMIGDEVYLFEPELGLPIPGPDQVGIATLKQARRDESVLRRLKVPGFFDYPFDKADVQQVTAMLNLMPEAIATRMKLLQESLTGQRRMTLYVDADESSERWDAIAGVAGARWWPVPIQAEIYRAAMENQSMRDPFFAFWYQSQWLIMDAQAEMPQMLSQGRWRHLHGEFSDDEDDLTEGARTLYLSQRAPEFEIADLRIDLELQKAYGLRRELGMDNQQFEAQIAQVQSLMRQGKRTATYWLSLVQYDDGRIETARNWFDKRVLDPAQPTPWEPAARYNLARTEEQLGQTEAAVKLLKTVGDPQEQGNRIRARLIGRD